ncbi:MAG: hypothetical protein Q7S24_01985, partial [bacterium]|nr:hypothetical protein [bacterium]
MNICPMLAYLQTGWHYLWNILRPRRKLGWRGFVVMGVIALAVVLVTSPLAHADLIDTVVGVLADIILWIATLFLKLSIFCLTFIIDVAGYNGYLDSMAVNYGWVMVRDLTNMIFVVILLLIAFGTILGIEQYEWKKMLVKFVAAAILVNFSRIICGVIIDVGQVVMITFINGVAATAGGNLINAFGAGEIMTLAEGGSTAATPGEVFLAAVMAVVFAGMMLMTMLVYLVILVARMVQLWVLIVLSPFAFVFSVIPTTQKYASEWWQKFGSNVVSGPIVAFFLWLSFVTVGGGTVGDEVHKASATKKDVNDGTQSAGITKAMSWAKMANFAIAIGMLLVGAETAQKLGVTGGSMMSKVGDFGKKAAMIASGVALGKWVGGKAKQGGKFLGKKTLMNVPLVGGHAWQRYGAQIKNKAIIAGTKWNEKVGSRLGSIAQFGAHEKIMKERKAQAEQLLGSMSSSAKGRQNEFFKDKEGNLVKRKAYKADGTEDKEALFGIEKVRAYTDLIQGEGKIKKEASEAVRRERIAKAGAGKVDKVYAEKIAGATTAETNLTTAKTKVEIDFLNDPKSKGGALVEARANANSWDTNKQKQMMSMLGVIRSKRAKAAEEVVAGIGGDTRAKNAQLNKDRATFFE